LSKRHIIALIRLTNTKQETLQQEYDNLQVICKLEKTEANKQQADRLILLTNLSTRSAKLSIFQLYRTNLSSFGTLFSGSNWVRYAFNDNTFNHLMDTKRHL
jgi:hypothetical protein